jgi:hypothetical protein
MFDSKQVLSRQIIESLRKGSVPAYGASQFYHVTPVVRRITDEDLRFVKSGGYVTKFFYGRYGQGKTLTLATIRDKGLEGNFATSFVTLDPSSTVFHKLEVVYQSIFNNLSIKVDQEILESSAAVNAILYEWCKKNQMSRSHSSSGFPEAPELTAVLSQFTNQQTLRPYITEWFMGAGHIPASIKRQFDIVGGIDRVVCMNFLKAFSKIVVHAGYSGLIVLFDEVESILSLRTKLNRDTAYDNLRNFVDDRFKFKNVYFAFGGTPEFFSDTERGVPSFQPLSERISHYWKSIHKSPRSPILELNYPDKHEFLLTLKRIEGIYNQAYNAKIYFDDKMINNYIDENTKNRGTARELIRGYIAFLDQRAEQQC